MKKYEKNLSDLELDQEVLDLTPKVLSIKKKTGKLDFMKIKNVSSVNDPVKRMKNKLQIGRKYLQTIYLLNKGLIHRIY